MGTFSRLPLASRKRNGVPKDPVPLFSREDLGATTLLREGETDTRTAAAEADLTTKHK
jgi:hypothetical protein